VPDPVLPVKPRNPLGLTKNWQKGLAFLACFIPRLKRDRKLKGLGLQGLFQNLLLYIKDFQPRTKPAPASI